MSTQVMNNHSAIVIGAGAGGLVAAWQLARSGCDALFSFSSSLT